MKRLVSVLALAVSTLWVGPDRALAQAPPPASPPPGLAIGDVVPEFEAQAIDGSTQRVTYPKGSSTVVLFFLSSCPTCHRMLPLWSAQAKKSKGVRVIAVMLDREPPGFFEANRLDFPVLRSPGPQLSRDFKLQKVPTTVRVGAGGKVEGAASGLLDPIRLGELFRPGAS